MYSYFHVSTFALDGNHMYDEYYRIPVHTLFDCYQDGGVVAMAFSRDTKHLVTVGTGKAQVSVTAWFYFHGVVFGQDCETHILGYKQKPNYDLWFPQAAPKQ